MKKNKSRRINNSPIHLLMKILFAVLRMERLGVKDSIEDEMCNQNVVSDLDMNLVIDEYIN